MDKNTPIKPRCLESAEQLGDALATAGYIASDETAIALFLACRLQKPLLIEGPPGVGKTELAKTASSILAWPLIRLQCYEGLDESKALYEWKYGKQLLYTQVLKQQLDQVLGRSGDLNEAMDRLHALDDVFFSARFLEPRPLLRALQSDSGAVLLIDEVDKSEEEFEALLLEVLSDYQVSIPELGTIRATSIPLVILTSNQQRELSDALKRRCIHLFIPFPDRQQETDILRRRLPEISELLAGQIASFVDRLRALDLVKQPAISETLDWARALTLLQTESLDSVRAQATLNVLLKHQADIDAIRLQLADLL